MSQRTIDIEKTAMKLSNTEREKLAAILMRSLNDEPLTTVDEAWVKEAESRFSAYLRGDHAGIPVDMAFARLDHALQK